MDLTPVDVVGKRCYYFIHAEDVEGIRHSHLDCKYTPNCIDTRQSMMHKIIFLSRELHSEESIHPRIFVRIILKYLEIYGPVETLHSILGADFSNSCA